MGFIGARFAAGSKRFAVGSLGFGGAIGERTLMDLDDSPGTAGLLLVTGKNPTSRRFDFGPWTRQIARGVIV